MYYPIQIPYILDNEFLKYIEYSEEKFDNLSDFIICYWQMIPFTNKKIQIDNIIITDGCIDIVVDFNNKIIGFSGMSKTNFHFQINLPNRFMGLRLMPGAFHQITGILSHAAMDKFLPISEVYSDFNLQLFFSLPFNKAKTYLLQFIASKINKVHPNQYTKLFNELSQNPPVSVKEIYSILHLSPSQCQRNFIKYYGITPKSVLSILRFQKCLKILTSSDSKPSDILELVQYYDQSHFINDFRRHMGITPFELYSKYNDD